MNAAQQTPSTPDDRIMAALAHGAIILGLWGIVVSAVLWATQKEKSAYVRFQALQALIYQIVDFAAQMLLGLLLGICGFGLFFLMGFGGILVTAFMEDPTSMPIPLLFNVFPTMGIFCFTLPYLLIWLGFIVYAFYGAYQVYLGRDFRYAIIGERVERYLAQSQPTEV
jgi:uncharacterized Tic20 family protein